MSLEPVSQPPSRAERSAPSRPRSGRADRQEAIFGSFDGMTSTLGLVEGLLATRASAAKSLAAAVGIAIAATVGMGAGQYLSDVERNRCKTWVMAAATVIGSFLPALPFIFGTSPACLSASLAITLVVAGGIGHYKGYVVTYSILLVVSIITVVLSIAVA